MLASLAFALIAITPVSATQTPAVGPFSGASSEQIANLTDPGSQPPMGTRQASLDVSGSMQGGTAPARGRPRVSQTRCAFVGCAPQCDVKGTRDADGNAIYRTPRSPLYSEAETEKMFCSLADAEAAGYRQSEQG
jgi:hypothetical protein